LLHQFITGGISSDSERRLRVGSQSDFDAEAIPSGLDYVALGHLHRPQQITCSPSPAFYAGSPIAYSFSEAGQQKRAVLVEIEPGHPMKITSVPLTSGRPLEIWPIHSIDDALDRAAEANGPSPLVEVRANFGRLLLPPDEDALFSLLGITVVSVRDLFDPSRRELSARATGEPAELGVEDLFRELWLRKHGDEPDEETVAEFVSALLEVGTGDERTERRKEGAR
jgi:exonuclease SbcD